jgi:pyruvate kinase
LTYNPRALASAVQKSAESLTFGWDKTLSIHRLQGSRTKTVATVGPACGSPEKLVELLQAGVDVFRINMAHGSRESHTQAVADIRAASATADLPAAILVDLAGPKIRLGQLTQDPLILENGQTVRFVRGEVSAADDELTCIYQPLIDEVNAGDAIVLADGLARLQVTTKEADQLICEVIDGGKIRSRQGVNLPGTHLSVPAMGDIDKDNAAWAAEQGVEFVSLSFVRNATEVEELIALLKQHNSDALVVSKIEKAEALENLDEIVQATGAVMVARGDLGVEIPIEKTPGAQKRIIRTCLQYRKPVIVATQMLESMHTSKQPTRAEVTDVANAILDGADACMLSGETAIGEYPVAAVTMMNKIMVETEKALADRASRMRAYDSSSDWEVSDAVIFGSAQIAKRIGAKMVVIASDESQTALFKSKQRDFIPTVCITNCLKTYRRMSLFWGVTPVLCPTPMCETQLQSFVSQWGRELGDLTAGDPYVVVTDTEVLPGIHDSVLVARIV